MTGPGQTGGGDPGLGVEPPKSPPKAPVVPAQPADLDPPRIGDEYVTDPPRPHEEPMVVGSAAATAITTLDDQGPVAGAGGPAFRGVRRLGDRLFAAVSTGAGIIVIAIVVMVGIFLVEKAWPALTHDKANFFFSRQFSTDTTDANGKPILKFGVLGLLWGTVAVSIIAILLAFPVATGIALFITQYANPRLARPVAYVIDLLAAIPSIVYGIWGITVLAPALEPIQRALYHLGWIPFFKNQNALTGTIFDAGVVLAVMILPIMTAISRDVFARTPRANVEAAWALGATKWEMIRLSVLPYGRAGVVSGAMLGLGRALGETVAMYLILSAPGQGAPFHASFFTGAETFASKIANNAAEFENPQSAGAYIAAGLVLFVLTFIVNAAARSIVNRKASS